MPYYTISMFDIDDKVLISNISGIPPHLPAEGVISNIYKLGSGSMIVDLIDGHGTKVSINGDAGLYGTLMRHLHPRAHCKCPTCDYTSPWYCQVAIGDELHFDTNHGTRVKWLVENIQLTTGLVKILDMQSVLRHTHGIMQWDMYVRENKLHFVSKREKKTATDVTVPTQQFGWANEAKATYCGYKSWADFLKSTE